MSIPESRPDATRSIDSTIAQAYQLMPQMLGRKFGRLRGRRQERQFHSGVCQ
jgi:hypothetical protein